MVKLSSKYNCLILMDDADDQENNARRDVESKLTVAYIEIGAFSNRYEVAVNVILEQLGNLPLALAQAGSYIEETILSVLAYAKHYDEALDRLMGKQGKFPLDEYEYQKVLTIWNLSYELIRDQCKKAEFLLKLLDWQGDTDDSNSPTFTTSQAQTMDQYLSLRHGKWKAAGITTDGTWKSGQTEAMETLLEYFRGFARRLDKLANFEMVFDYVGNDRAGLERLVRLAIYCP
jgi:hypothetical protein